MTGLVLSNPSLLMVLYIVLLHGVYVLCYTYHKCWTFQLTRTNFPPVYLFLKQEEFVRTHV